MYNYTFFLIPTFFFFFFYLFLLHMIFSPVLPGVVVMLWIYVCVMALSTYGSVCVLDLFTIKFLRI